MTIPLARIHHLEQAIRRRRRYAKGLTDKNWCLRWYQYECITALLQALHRSRAVYHHNAAKLETTKV